MKGSPGEALAKIEKAMDDAMTSLHAANLTRSFCYCFRGAI